MSIASEMTRKLKAEAKALRVKFDKEERERLDGIAAAAAKAEQDAADIAREEASAALHRANAALARRISTGMAKGELAEEVPDVATRTAMAARYGANLGAVRRAVSSDTEPALGSQDVPEFVLGDGGKPRPPYQVVKALLALAYLVEVEDKGKERVAAAARERVARERMLALADLSDEEYAAMVKQQEQLER